MFKIEKLTTLYHELVKSEDLDALQSLGQDLSTMVNSINLRIRQLNARNFNKPGIKNFDNSKEMEICVLKDKTPWSNIQVEKLDIPGMINDEERQYYKYIGQFYSGKGKIIELGPWLGNSTHFILKGLEVNPFFENQKLHVFDDFVWRSEWMNDKVKPEDILEHHQDFLFLFEKYTSDISEKIIVKKRRLNIYSGNESIEPLEWDGQPIEMMYVDCGRTIEVNDTWFKLFSKSFIPGVTMLVLEDWKTHLEVPVKWYNQIKLFVESKGPRLQLLHELKKGAIATFLFKG